MFTRIETMTRIDMTRKTHLLHSGLFALALLGGISCSGGGGGGASPEATLTVAITDAASDELAFFDVELTSIVLTRAAGGQVGVLAAPVEVDLTTLTEISQVLNILSIPPGAYTAATVTIDFTDAECYLVGETDPAEILDSDGVAITGSMTFPIDVQGLLLGVAGRHKILELDFDLDQSVQVDAGANAVSLEPSFVMRVDHSDPKELFLPGTLVSVDAPAGSFVCELRTLQGELLKTVTVQTDASTVFQVDGVPTIGAAGLAALATEPAGTWVQTYGAIHPVQAAIEATYVEVGNGTYNGGGDIVQGHVVGRVGGAGSDAVLTVLGHSNDAAHSSFLFNTEFTVMTSFAGTTVVRRGGVQLLDGDDLNIGQQVRIFGTLAGTTMDTTGGTGVIRVQPTRVLGYAAGPVSGGEVTIDVSRIDLRTQDQFTWGEGGTTPVDPDALVAEVGNLGNGLGIEAGSAVVVHGFFTAIDDDGADFTATSVINRDLSPTLLAVHDRLGGMTLSPTITPTELTLAISGTPGIGELAVIDRGFVGSILLPTDPVPTIVPATGFVLYSIRDRDTGAISVHTTFAAYADALDTAFQSSAVIFNLGALGTYEESTNTLSASLISTIVD